MISKHLVMVCVRQETSNTMFTRALSAKSCTRDTDQSSFLHSAMPRARDGLSVSLMQDLAKKALVPKLDSYIQIDFQSYDMSGFSAFEKWTISRGLTLGLNNILFISNQNAIVQKS